LAGLFSEAGPPSKRDGRAERLRDLFAELTGMSARKAAEELNRRGIEAPAGGKWFATQVIGIRAVALPRAAAGLSASTDREVASCEAYEARFTGVIR